MAVHVGERDRLHDADAARLRHRGDQLGIGPRIAGEGELGKVFKDHLEETRSQRSAIKALLGEAAFLKPGALWWLLRGGYRAFPDRSLSGLATPARISLAVSSPSSAPSGGTDSGF